MAAAPLNLARSMIQDVTFRSQVTPDATWDPFRQAAPQQQGGVMDFVMRQIKPAMYVRTAGGVVAAEPYGTPDENYLPALVVGATAGAVAVGGAIFLAGVWWGRRSARRR